MGVLDLVGFAVDVHQSAQLYHTREQLRRIEQGTLQETARRQVLETWRHFVFVIGQNLKSLEQQAEYTPQATYVASRMLLWRLQDVGITPEVFPEFADKEYVQQVRDRLHHLAQHTHDRLTQSQQEQAEMCFRFLVEMPLLDQAIEAQQALEQLRATDNDWQQISGKRNRMMLIGAVALLAACPLGALISSIPQTFRSSFYGYEGLFIGASCFIPLVLGIIGLLLLLIKNSTYSNLFTVRQELLKKQPNEESRQNLVKLFGDNADFYYQIRAERLKVIQQVMGQVQGYDPRLTG